MITLLNKKVTKLYEHYTRSSFKKISVEGGACRYNFHCHINAINDAINDKEPEIAMVIYIEDGYPVIHFINLTAAGVYVDNTLGQWSQKVDYYLVRHLGEDEFWDVCRVHTSYKKALAYQLLPWYILALSDYRA